MKKGKVIFAIVILLVSTLTACISTYLYNANKVGRSDKLTAKDVQGSINELFDASQNYSSMNTRVTGLEGYFTSNPTSIFSGSALHIGRNQTSGTQSFTTLYYGGDQIGGLYTGSQGLTLAGKNGSSANWGTGQVNIKASTINIGSSNATTDITGTLKHGGYEIGEKIAITPSSGVTLSSGTTLQKMTDITLAPGRWILIYSARFNKNANGKRFSGVYTSYADSTCSSLLSYTLQDALNGIDGEYVYLKGSFITDKLSSNTTYYLCGYQDSGGNLSASIRVYAVRIA